MNDWFVCSNFQFHLQNLEYKRTQFINRKSNVFMSKSFCCQKGYKKSIYRSIDNRVQRAPGTSLITTQNLAAHWLISEMYLYQNLLKFDICKSPLSWFVWTNVCRFRRFCRSGWVCSVSSGATAWVVSFLYVFSSLIAAWALSSSCNGISSGWGFVGFLNSDLLERRLDSFVAIIRAFQLPNLWLLSTACYRAYGPDRTCYRQ